MSKRCLPSPFRSSYLWKNVREQNRIKNEDIKRIESSRGDVFLLQLLENNLVFPINLWILDYAIILEKIKFQCFFTFLTIRICSPLFFFFSYCIIFLFSIFHIK